MILFSVFIPSHSTHSSLFYSKTRTFTIILTQIHTSCRQHFGHSQKWTWMGKESPQCWKEKGNEKSLLSRSLNVLHRKWLERWHIIQVNSRIGLDTIAMHSKPPCSSITITLKKKKLFLWKKSWDWGEAAFNYQTQNGLVNESVKEG